MIDTVRINLHAGDGGNGCVSFLREKYKPHGGPMVETAVVVVISTFVVIPHSIPFFT